MMTAGFLILSSSMERLFRTELHCCCCCFMNSESYDIVQSDTEEGYHATLSAEWINREVIELVMFSSLVYFIRDDKIKVSVMP